jgi:hypothetical protein
MLVIIKIDVHKIKTNTKYNNKNVKNLSSSH